MNDASTTTVLHAPVLTAGRTTGFVREWHPGAGKGYGKIYARAFAAEKGENFFFHRSSVSNVHALAKGVKVSFEIAAIQTGKHRRAVNVEVVG